MGSRSVEELLEKYGEYWVELLCNPDNKLGRTAALNWLQAHGEPCNEYTARRFIDECKRIAANPDYTPLGMDQSVVKTDPESPVREANGRKVDFTQQIRKNDDGSFDIQFTAKSDFIKPDELLRKLNIDPNKWIVTVGSIKSWQGFMKGPDGEPKVVPLTSWSAKVEARAMSLDWKPPEIKIEWGADPLPPNQSNTSTAVFLGDAHVGYYWKSGRHNELIELHDSRAMDACLQYIDDMKPDYVFILGDWLDHAATGKHDHDPRYRQTLTPSIHTVAWWVARIREAAGSHARLMWTPGNHDNRPSRAISKHIPELHNYMSPGAKYASYSLSDMLGDVVESARLEVASDPHFGEDHGAGFWLWGSEAKVPVWVSHGETLGSNGITLVSKALNLPGSFSRVFGHAHRLGQGHKTELRPGGGALVRSATCPGCLCHVDTRIPAQKSGKAVFDWQQGISTAVLHKDTRTVYHSLHQIIDGTLCISDGSRYIGRDRRKQIAADLDIAAIDGPTPL